MQQPDDIGQAWPSPLPITVALALSGLLCATSAAGGTPEGHVSVLEIWPDPVITGGRVILRADQPAMVSIDGAAMRPLPLDLTADGMAHELVFSLRGCTGRRTLTFLSQAMELTCTEPAGPQILLTVDIATRVELRVDGNLFHTGDAGPHDAIIRRLPPGAAVVEVACGTPEQIGWYRKYNTRYARRLIAHCAPIDARDAVIVSANIGGARFLRYGQPLPGLIRAPRPLILGQEEDDTPSRYAESGVEYLTTEVGRGRHTLCATANGHRQDCRKVTVGQTQSATRVEFVLLPEHVGEAPDPVIRHHPERHRPHTDSEVLPAGSTEADVRPEATNRAWPIALILGGGVIGGTGAAMWIGAHHDAYKAREHLRGGLISEVSERRLQQYAGQWSTTGQVVSAVGTAALIGGVIWLLTEDEPARLFLSPDTEIHTEAMQ